MRKIFLSFIFILSVSSAYANTTSQPEAFTSVSVESLADHDYYPRLRQFIASASISVDVAIDKAGITAETDKDPVWTLLQDLIDAAKRGCYVRLFLNTFHSGLKDSIFLREDILSNLKTNSIEVHFVNPHYLLSDRTVIIDRKIVIEGGLPWVKDELEKGFGSAAVIYSASLAQQKKVRLELLPLWNVAAEKEEKAEGRLPVPVYLLKELKYLPTMIKLDDSDALKIYLVLLRNFYAAHKTEFKVNLLDLSSQIPSANYADKMALQFQVLKSIRRLDHEYGLIKINQEQANDISLQVLLPQSIEPVVGVPHPFFDEGYAKDLSGRAIFAYLVILYRSQSTGESPVWLGSENNVEQDFPVAREQFRLGAQELREKNLIEIYPFSLMPEANIQPKQQLEYRYLVNDIPTVAERLETWARMREEFGDDEFVKAKRMAELFGEPEDPKVIAAYLELRRQFPDEDIESLTQHLKTLPPQSTPELLQYLQTLLENESKGGFQLATYQASH